MKKVISALLAIFVILAFTAFSTFAAVGGEVEFIASYATVAPVIDGEIDDIWESTMEIHTVFGSSDDYACGSRCSDTNTILVL